MLALKSFLMNVMFDLRQEITSLQLQLQQEKLSKSKPNSSKNEEKMVIENLKSQITSYKAENTFLKEEMKSKQNILDEILYQNSHLLKFDHYFNNTTNKKENIREDKECHNKLNHQQKNQLSKEKTVLSNESEKRGKQNTWKRSEKSFHHRGFHDKKYNWYGNIKKKYKNETSSRCYKYSYMRLY